MHGRGSQPRWRSAPLAALFALCSLVASGCAEGVDTDDSLNVQPPTDAGHEEASTVLPEVGPPDVAKEVASDVAVDTTVPDVVPDIVPDKQPDVDAAPTPTCTDDRKNGDETDIDCGGPLCPACSVGDDCLTGTDCDSDVCGASKTCSAPSCGDNVMNGAETDVDCGGAACAACANGLGCAVGSDCQSDICGPGGTCVPSSCADNVKNGTETDVDCGGTQCGGCATGRGCGIGSDCLSGVCATNHSCSAPTCNDNVKNGLETDVDCGGTQCASCANGLDCQTGTDCISGVCGSNDTCRAPTCNDNVKNGSETDVDCGGITCSGCPPGGVCKVNQDCSSLNCVNGTTCASPTCWDGIQNQGETRVDCGGPCAPCGFLHQEDYDSFPSWGPDGAYQVSGPCNADPLLGGWGVTDVAHPNFTLGSSYYGVIFTDDPEFVGTTCDDYMLSPLLTAHSANTISISFDTSLAVFDNTLAEVILERDGVPEVVWSATTDQTDRHIMLGPYPGQGATNIRVVWHYVGEYEYFWMVDNIVVTGS